MKVHVVNFKRNIKKYLQIKNNTEYLNKNLKP